MWDYNIITKLGVGGWGREEGDSSWSELEIMIHAQGGVTGPTKMLL